MKSQLKIAATLSFILLLAAPTYAQQSEDTSKITTTNKKNTKSKKVHTKKNRVVDPSVDPTVRTTGTRATNMNVDKHTPAAAGEVPKETKD